MKTKLLKVFRAFQYQPTADVNGLYELSEKVLALILEDAHMMIAAQLESHLSTNQRGFAIASIALAGATAVSGTYFALDQAEIPVHQAPMVTLTIGFLISALLAVISVRPTAFCLPGNEPKNWLPSTWEDGVSRNTKRAVFEKLKILQSQIQQNKTLAVRRALLQTISFACAAVTVIVFGVMSA